MIVESKFETRPSGFSLKRYSEIISECLIHLSQLIKCSPRDCFNLSLDFSLNLVELTSQPLNGIPDGYVERISDLRIIITALSISPK